MAGDTKFRRFAFGDAAQRTGFFRVSGQLGSLRAQRCRPHVDTLLARSAHIKRPYASIRWIVVRRRIYHFESTVVLRFCATINIAVMAVCTG